MKVSTTLGMGEREYRALCLHSRIMCAVACYLGGSYTTKRPQAPFDIPGTFAALGNGKATNCSTMTACLLAAVYPHLSWSREDYADLQIFDSSRPHSPMDAVIRRGIGRQVPDFIPGRWHLVQGWRSIEPLRGHAFLVQALVHGPLLVLQASSKGSVGPTCDVMPSNWVVANYKHSHFIAVLSE